jgi:plasmid stabilization system protein ParE
VTRYAVRFDREATSDLASIRDYLAHARDLDFADNFIDRVIAYCESLGVLPHRGTRRDSVLPGLRTVTWRRAITIAFQVKDEAKQVVVLGAFYRGRDYIGALQKRLE